MKEKLAAFTLLVTEYFQGDPTAPSVIFAWLPKQERFYSSVARYTAKFGGDKAVVAQAQSDDIENCFDILVFEFNNYRANVAKLEA